jgi:putative lipoic acid-binding regulatory protein
MAFFDQLKTRLDTVHTWPSNYLFKFIVPMHKKGELLDVLPTGLIEEKLSRTGKYISISLKTRIEASDEVIAVYQKASTIEGIVSL